MRGWMAQNTCASPAAVKVTSVEAPGRCEPRLNSFPLLIDAMLWGTLSSLRNVSDPPALMVTLSIENIRPCWRIVCSATRPPAAGRQAEGNDEKERGNLSH